MLIRMKKLIFLLIITLLFASSIYAQNKSKVHFNIFISIQKIKGHPRTDFEYKTIMLPATVKESLKSKIFKNQKQMMKKSKNINVKRRGYYLSSTDYIIIYKAVYEDYKHENYNKIYSIRIKKTPKDINGIVLNDIRKKHSAIYDYYKNDYKVLYKGQPYNLKKGKSLSVDWWKSIRANIFKLLDNKEKVEMKKEYNKAVGGVRG